MPVSPCCEYYGYLPKLIRKAAPSAFAPVATLASPLPSPQSSPADNVSSSSAPHDDRRAPSTYTLSKPLTYAIAELPPKPPSSLRLVIISDTHERHREMTVPNGDILVHCGDIQECLSFCRSVDAMLADFSKWLNDPVLHPHPVKLVIAGNHDKAIAAMKTEAVRQLFAPALYLCDESAIVEPAGVRFYGSPRSVANSRWSPNTAFQSRTFWKPFMFDTTTTTTTAATTTAPTGSTAERVAAPPAPADPSGNSPLHVRLEGTIPGGPIDILMTHQSPDVPPARHTVNEQPICTYVQQVAPRRALFCGHLHGAHGMHRLPVPLAVAGVYGLQKTAHGRPVDEEELEEIPFTVCINASMMVGRPGAGRLLPASVVDLEL